ncbi:MAG: quinolinate synthase NadA [Candidatus Eremiobacteraeota bacterium]|nr:quinolinate synthase NadA [Candidatus Eremiobacteraeota bacterium]
MDNQRTVQEIRKLRIKRNAVIMAHNYQVKEVQDIADYVGDSLELARIACKVDKDVIVFCGVRFMAESAKMLNPEKIVLLPVPDAGCTLADMITVRQLKEFKKKYPDAETVCYINSSAEVKAISDICCTSSNAVKIIDSIDSDMILFLPDKNLGSHASKFAPGKEIILWNGFCATHNNTTREEIEKARQEHPDAEILVHPECSPEVLELSDFIGSTSQILKRASVSKAKKMLIGTEKGLLHGLKKNNPEKEFYLLSQSFICEDMKKTKLEDVLKALENMQYKVEVKEDIRIKAVKTLDRMLAIK